MAENAKENPLSGFASGLGFPLSWSPGWLTEFSPDFSPLAFPGTAETKPKAKEQEKEAGG